MSTDEVVIINDDNQKDSDVEIVDISKETESNEPKSLNSGDIVIDVDDNQQTDGDVIEVIDVDNDTVKNHMRDYLNDVCNTLIKDNPVIVEFVEKCLDLENTSGMLRVIHRNFLPLYFKMDDGHRKSAEFRKVMEATIQALEVRPNQKFSHVKSVCNVMKDFKLRKKVPFVTLATDVGAKHKDRKRRRNVEENVIKTKRKVEHIIILDDLDETSDRNCNPGAVELSSENLDTSGGGSQEGNNKVLLHDSNNIVISEDINDKPNNSNKENDTQVHCQNTNSTKDPNANAKIVVPQTICRIPSNLETYQKEQTIRVLEIKLEFYTSQIEHLEQQEVDDDSVNSPYVRCEKLKALIVSLYKELCELTGHEPIKRRTVKFKATDDRNQLPLKIIEELINGNRGSDGSLHFPDFYEVVECVGRANREGNLGWSDKQVVCEARNLFTYCGQALQQNRKKRDWRYLLRRLKSKPGQDPAEIDPQLMARLDANRRIGLKREYDLLDKIEQCGNRNITSNNFQVCEDATYNEVCNYTFGTTFNNSANNLNIQNCAHNYSYLEYNHQYFVYGNRNDRTDLSSNVTVDFLQENNAEIRETSNMIEVYKNSELKIAALTGNNNKNKSETSQSLALANTNKNKVTSMKMLEICIEKDKELEIKIVEVPVNNCNKSINKCHKTLESSDLLVSDNNIRKSQENIEDRHKTSDVLVSQDKINDNSPGNIVIQDVYSIASEPETPDIESTSGVDGFNGAENNISKNIETMKKSLVTDGCVIHNNSSDKDDRVENIDTSKSAHSVLEDSDTASDKLKEIKPEPLDTLKDMEMFGDAITTATVYDIEDPFLVIEISDSSDESDDD